MRIYFEDYLYPPHLLEEYFGKMLEPYEGKVRTRYVGYVYNKAKYDGPIFILPKALLLKRAGKYTFLGMKNAEPEKIIDLESPSNPLYGKEIINEISGFSIWVHQVIRRFYDENKKTSIVEEADLRRSSASASSGKKDLLSASMQLIDFFKEHETIFTTITKENHSGNNNTSWQRTISRTQPYIDQSTQEPMYVQTVNKKKELDTNEKLIILFYSVLNYLKKEYHLKISLGDLIYPILPAAKVGTMVSSGITPKEIKGNKSSYFREDLRELWKLLDAFFKYNRSTDEQKRDLLVVGNFHIVFEAMIDKLLSDQDIPDKLKYQNDDKIVDHIYLDRSLTGTDSNIYFIGDSKYYKDANDITGVPLYKQFTYARNAIQFNVEQLYLQKAVGAERLKALRYRDSIPLDMNFTAEELQRFRDSLTEGYNVTPNFFIRNGVPDGQINYADPQLKANDNLKEDIQKQFEDRLFDRDTLLLREYYINLFFVMRAYATDEDWSDELHKIIREDLIKNLNRKYNFYRIYPKENPVPFVWMHFHEIIGKAYRTELFADDIILAFENTPEGDAHKAAIERSIGPDIVGDMQKFDLEP
jgi:hypothetical protein